MSWGAGWSLPSIYVGGWVSRSSLHTQASWAANFRWDYRCVPPPSTHISEDPVISLLAWQCRLQGQECLFQTLPGASPDPSPHTTCVKSLPEAVSIVLSVVEII